MIATRRPFDRFCRTSRALLRANPRAGKTMNPNDKVYDEPSQVKAVDGCVEVDGPDQVDVALTPEAAIETSERLLSQAFSARGQKRLKRHPHQADQG
jgi:hypothetical protein